MDLDINYDDNVMYDVMSNDKRVLLSDDVMLFISKYIQMINCETHQFTAVSIQGSTRN